MEVQRLQAEDDDIAHCQRRQLPSLGAEKVAFSYNSASGRRFSDGKKVRLQLVLPSRLHKKVIRDLHEGAVSGHLGEEKVPSQLKERFYSVAMLWRGSKNMV